VDRIDRRISGALLFSNLDGALFVFIYLTVLSPHQMPSAEQGPVSDLVLFIAFAAVTFPFCGWLCQRAAERPMTWLRDDRAPTPEEREGTLRVPFLLARVSFATWVVAAVFFTGTSMAWAEHPETHYVKIAVTILMGGLVSCTVGFLLVERWMRPVFALALADGEANRSMTLGVRPRLVLGWALGSGVILLSLAALPISARQGGGTDDIGGAVVALSLAGLVAGLLITLTSARAVADPLTEIREALDRVRTGDLDVVVPVDDGGEVGLLQTGVNQMVAGLRERQRLADLFGAHVGTEVAERALAQGSGLSSEQREASALFVDLIGSTAMAEVLPPEAVVESLNTFFGAVVRVVAAEGGWVNKFEGDGALCVFGAPAVQPDHAARALRAARRLRTELQSLAPAHPGLDAAIGVSSGHLVAGNVGTEQRYEYTVIGRPVNQAARLSDLAKGRGARVLASAEAIERSGDEATHWMSRGTVGLRGQTAPTAIYEPIEVREPVTA
jgi:adenylate cyclase